MSGDGPACDLRDGACESFQPAPEDASVTPCVDHWVAVLLRMADVESNYGDEPVAATLTDRQEAARLSGGARRWDRMPAGCCEFAFPDFNALGPVPALTL
ncbi:hypothetical protein [Rubrimonas cliftonensis]|uniref:Uncharacterized protein n=1 Tax=Rubrimonas cliftonensis TaxID=89524 RepID=A0A1H4AVQ0_9RHOB|nr:hypothetical protein [Rubrimonas cliftonensis]SEA39712.1 hypothetical protein SAMN05444370_104382 [Rubrimonas cliftonensis]